MEKQPLLPGRIALQELSNVRVQVDFAVRSVRLQIFGYARCIFFDLLLDLDGAAAVNEVPRLDGEGFGNSHPCRGEQNVEHTLLSLTVRDELRNSLGFERGSL